ncbi:MAG: tripartite tricarboxylate transporter permease [Burkholderiaceae bacterium]
MTTLDGYPMTRNGESGKALRVAHLASVSGDTFSDLVLITCAPFLAVLVEAYLGFTEKAALIILSLAFIAAVVGRSVSRGLLSMALGLLFASIATGEDGYPRLSLGLPALAQGFPLVAAVLGVLILGEIFATIEALWRSRAAGSGGGAESPPQKSAEHNRPALARRAVLHRTRRSRQSSVPSSAHCRGSDRHPAHTLGYATGRRIHAAALPSATAPRRRGRDRSRQQRGRGRRP